MAHGHTQGHTDGHTHCHIHGTAPSAGTCRSCLHEYCADCLVHAYGRAKPPFCLRCALVAAGGSPASGEDRTVLDTLSA